MELNLKTSFTDKSTLKRQPRSTEDQQNFKKRKFENNDKNDVSNSWARKKLKRQQNEKDSSSPIKNDKSNNKDFSSSLFSGNPDLPDVNLKSQTQKIEPVFSLMDVSELNVHSHLKSCLENRLEIKKLTAVQQLAIPALLSGKEALIKSQTGSGKTLSYAVPIIEDLQSMEPRISRTDGIHAIIVLPTRELAQQTYECFHKLAYSFTWLVPGCFSGGEKRKSEKARIRKGISILISTPGRLVDHIQNTATLDLSRIRWLVLDEADRLLDMGYEKDVTSIVDAINSKSSTKRTVMLSATLSKGVENLAHINMTDPEIIDVSSSENSSGLTDYITPSSLKHCFSFVPAKLRLVTLVSFVCEKCIFGNSKSKKMVVFLPTLDMVDYLHQLFLDLLVPVLPNHDDDDDDEDNLFFQLHGDMKQENRVKVFNGFRDAVSGVLLTTDVAARGLELPNVDWIVQLSAPAKTEDYIHRVGRTARIGCSGQALIFLLPSEEKFVKNLEDSKLTLNQLNYTDLLKSLLLLEDIPNESRRRNMSVEDQANALQLHFEKSILEKPKLLQSAKDAYLSYIRAYASYPIPLRPVLPFKELHLGHLAKSFCLRDTPKALGAGAYLRTQMNHRGDSSRSFNRGGSRSFDRGDSSRSFDRGGSRNARFDRPVNKFKKKTSTFRLTAMDTV